MQLSAGKPRCAHVGKEVDELKPSQIVDPTPAPAVP
jgi:hypothetical protein